MSNNAFNKGAPHDAGGQTPNKNIKGIMNSGRPAPINTTLVNEPRLQPLTATTTSSSVFSPSVRTWSSVQFTPATSNYSPSIWSDGAGTPMSISDTPEDTTPSAKPVKEASDAKKAEGNVPDTPSKVPNPNAQAIEDLASLPAHHQIKGEPGKRYAIAYYDESGGFLPLKFPLSRGATGGYRDANGTPCLFPRKCDTYDIKYINVAASGQDAGMPQGASIANNNDVESTHTVVASTYEVGDEEVEPFIETALNSDITPHYTSTHPHLAGMKPPIFSEEPAGGNFKVQLNERLPIIEAFPGAINLIKSLNPSHFSMDLDTRVVALKTDEVNNVHWSVRRGVWAAMDKVGERINNLFDDRKGASQVFLLVSINGQKSYCGLAIMGGHWQETGPGELEGWKERDMETKTMGTLPVQWVYVKNVSYEYFKDITHTHSGQPIVNMWNGMHFPTDKGREVMEVFVKKAHFTNVLTWRDDRSYNPFRFITHAAVLDPRLKNTPNDMTLIKRKMAAEQAQEGGNTTAVVAPMQQQPTISATATLRDRRGIAGSNINTTPPNLDGAASPSPFPGQRVSIDCIVDANGNYVPVTPTSEHATNPGTPNRTTSFTPPHHGGYTHVQQLRVPPQTNFNVRGRGGNMQGFRGNMTGRGGMTGQLRGAASFMNPGLTHLNQNGYGRGMPFALHGTHSFDNTFHGYPQPMQPHMGFPGAGGAYNNFNGGTQVTNFMPPMQRAHSAQYSTDVLRHAASKANLFVPAAAPSAPPPATSFNDASPGAQTSESASQMVSSTNASPKEEKSLQEMRAQMKEVEKEMLAESKRIIKMQGEWTSLHHELTEALKKKTGGVDPDAAGLPEADNIPDDSSEAFYDWKYEMGSSTTLERRIVSPVCNSEGNILDSVSKHDSPQTKARRREINHKERRYYGLWSQPTADSMEKRMIDNVDNLVNSPPPSVVDDHKEGEEGAGGVSLE